MNIKKNILAIDSTFESCSVALLSKNKIFHEFKNSKKNHIDKIFPMIKKCLLKANIHLKDVDVLGYCEGPGNFTGTRISIGIAKSFLFGSDLLVISVSSFLIMAQKAYRKFGIKNILVAINLKKKNIYFCCYRLKNNGFWSNVQMKSSMKIVDFINKINKLTGNWGLVGSFSLNYISIKNKNLSIVNTKIISPDALDMLPLILYKYKKRKTTLLKNIQPIYLFNEIYR